MKIAEFWPGVLLQASSGKDPCIFQTPKNSENGSLDFGRDNSLYNLYLYGKLIKLRRT